MSVSVRVSSGNTVISPFQRNGQRRNQRRMWPLPKRHRRLVKVVTRGDSAETRILLVEHSSVSGQALTEEDLISAIEDQLDLIEARESLREAEEFGTVTLDQLRAELGY